MKKMIMSIGKVLVFFVLWSVSVGLVPIPEFSNPAIWRLFAEIIPLLITVLWTFLFILFDKVDIKCDIKNLFSKKIVLGFLLGLLWLGLTIAIIYAFGGLSFVSKNSVDQGYIWFIALFFNTIMQEMAIRGYIYQKLKKDSVIIAVVVSTFFFTILHGGAFEAGLIPVLNVITMSLFMTILLEYTQSLWPPIIVHYVWNAIGGLVLGGVSLADDYINIYQMNLHGNDLITGGAVKIEGSIIVLGLNLVLMLFFYRKIKTQHEIMKRTYPSSRCKNNKKSRSAFSSSEI